MSEENKIVDDAEEDSFTFEEMGAIIDNNLLEIESIKSRNPYTKKDRDEAYEIAFETYAFCLDMKDDITSLKTGLRRMWAVKEREVLKWRKQQDEKDQEEEVVEDDSGTAVELSENPTTEEAERPNNIEVEEEPIVEPVVEEKKVEKPKKGAPKVNNKLKSAMKIAKRG